MATVAQRDAGAQCNDGDVFPVPQRLAAARFQRTAATLPGPGFNRFWARLQHCLRRQLRSQTIIVQYLSTRPLWNSSSFEMH